MEGEAQKAVCEPIERFVPANSPMDGQDSTTSSS